MPYFPTELHFPLVRLLITIHVQTVMLSIPQILKSFPENLLKDCLNSEPLAEPVWLPQPGFHVVEMLLVKMDKIEQSCWK